MSARGEQQNPVKRTADGDQDNNGGTPEKRRSLERSQVTPSSATSQVTPSSVTSQVTPSSATSQVTPSSATSQVTPSSAASKVTPSSATSQVTPSSTTSQVTPSSATAQVMPSPTSSHACPVTVGGVFELHKIFRHLQNSEACRRRRDLGRELGLGEWVLDAIAHDNPRDIREQLYKMLLEWEQKRGKQAKPDLLIAALRRCDLNKVADMAEDLCKAQANPVLKDPDMYRENVELIRNELTEWYGQSLSKLHPIPWCTWMDQDFTHMFTNLEIVEGRKHQTPTQQQRLCPPARQIPAPPQGSTVDTEEGLVESLWGSSRPTVTFIEGAAGIGKSSLCRRLVLSWATDRLPVLRAKFTLVLHLEARTLVGNLTECITRQLFPEDFRLSNVDISTCITKYQNKCLLIIDGVDELTGNGKKVLQNLLDGRRFRRACVLLTGRPESTQRYIKYVEKQLRITGFTWENTKLYIRKFFKDNQPKVRDKLIERIEQDRNLQELSRTPFTTLLMCFLAEDCQGDIPTTRIDIMKDIVNRTVRRYLTRPKPTPTEDTTVEAILRAAAQVAYKGQKTDKVVFEESDLKTICTNKMSGHLLLSGLLNQDVILSRLDTKGYCYFPHKSIQDFLCARYLADLNVDGFTTTLAQNPGFRDNPTLCEMLLNMLRDQADKYGRAMTFCWSEGDSGCREVVVRSAVTVTDSGTLDTITDVFREYLSVHDLIDILYVPGGVRLCNLIVRRMLPVIISERIDQNTWEMVTDDSDWSPYSLTTRNRLYKRVQRVDLPVNCGVLLSVSKMSDKMWQDVTLPWVLTTMSHKAIELTKLPVKINVLCVCVTPTAGCITDLSSLIDRTRSSDLIVFILKPRAVTYEDSVYMRVLEVCKRAHSNRVRVSCCTVVTDVKTGMKTASLLREITVHSRYRLSTSPLQIHYNRHCPY